MVLFDYNLKNLIYKHPTFCHYQSEIGYFVKDAELFKMKVRIQIKS